MQTGAGATRDVEILVFKCGRGCSHTWISGRGSTSYEQICKSCGASVVGELVKGAALCELVKDWESKDDVGEVLRINFDRPFGRGLSEPELEEKLGQYLGSELRFFGKFFLEEGLPDWIAYRRGLNLDNDQESEGRDLKQDVRVLDQMASLIGALCRAEFEGTMRGGEADAKLQGLLNGNVKLRFLKPVTRAAHGRSTITVAVDFGIALEVEERILDKTDDRLRNLRRILKEMDRKLLAKHDSGPCLKHPRTLLANLIASFDWQRAVSTLSGKEGHDRVRCMTCRFIGEDCSVDVPRSQEVRKSLRQAPGFVFQATLVINREDRGGKSWQDRVSDFLEGVAGTRGGECFGLAETDSRGCLRLKLYSQPEWLGSAVDRVRTFAQGGGSVGLSHLVGLGRVARGLHVVEPPTGSPPKFEVVSDLSDLLSIFDEAISCPESASKRVRWNQLGPRCAPIAGTAFESTRALFRAFSSFECLEDFAEFLQDFRQGHATAAAKPVPRPPRVPDATLASRSMSRAASLASRATTTSSTKAHKCRESSSEDSPQSKSRWKFRRRAGSRSSSSNRKRRSKCLRASTRRSPTRSRTPSPRNSPSVCRPPNPEVT